MPASAGQKTNVTSVLSTLTTIRSSISTADPEQRELLAVLKRLEREIALARLNIKGGI